VALQIDIPSSSQDSIDIDKISAGKFHSLFLDSTGRRLYSCGSNAYGQLGNQTCFDKHSSTPKEVYLEFDTSEGKPVANPVISEIACGEYHNFVLTADGDVYAWGRNMSGELGIGNTGDHLECIAFPIKMDVLKGINILREREGEEPFVKATVHRLAGGASFSAIIATLV